MGSTEETDGPTFFIRLTTMRPPARLGPMDLRDGRAALPELEPATAGEAATGK
jgi:hypothetical protein